VDEAGPLDEGVGAFGPAALPGLHLRFPGGEELGVLVVEGGEVPAAGGHVAVLLEAAGAGHEELEAAVGFVFPRFGHLVAPVVG